MRDTCCVSESTFTNYSSDIAGHRLTRPNLSQCRIAIRTFAP
jgi:hypothetical protein